MVSIEKRLWVLYSIVNSMLISQANPSLLETKLSDNIFKPRSESQTSTSREFRKEVYYIDIDEIPEFFQWRKFRIQWRYDFYLSHGKILRLPRLSWSQPMKFIKVIRLIAIIFWTHNRYNRYLFLYFSTKIRMCVGSSFFRLIQRLKD